MNTVVLKERLILAIKAKSSFEKDLLRLILGEITSSEFRTGKTLTDEGVEKIIRKLVESNNETLRSGPSIELEELLNKQNVMLGAMLPQRLTIDDIIKEINLNIESEVKESKSDGQAVGVAMKHFREKGLSVDGNEVKSAVLATRH